MQRVGVTVEVVLQVLLQALSQALRCMQALSKALRYQTPMVLGGKLAYFRHSACSTASRRQDLSCMFQVSFCIFVGLFCIFVGLFCGLSAFLHVAHVAHAQAAHAPCPEEVLWRSASNATYTANYQLSNDWHVLTKSLCYAAAS